MTDEKQDASKESEKKQAEESESSGKSGAETEKSKKSRKKKRKKKKKDPRSKLFSLDRQPFVLSPSPHQYSEDSVPKIMWSVVGAVAPAAIMAVYYFGLPAVWMILACTFAALGTEVIINKIKGEGLTIGDGSAAITGLLLALTLPPSFPVTGGILGSVFAIAIGKQIFGGLGANIFNPALLGRAFLQASFPVTMTTWTLPNTAKFSGVDAVSAATPLGQFKFEQIMTNYGDLLVGNIGGSLGETSAIAILLGGIYLLVKKYADWRIPVSFLGSVFLLGGLFWLINPSQYPDPVFHLLSGGLMFGAFFMATDMVTSPITPKGAWIFGAGAGLILIVIRIWGGLPEGVMYSILLMNSVTPLINRYTRPKVFGEVRA
ncbi:MAG: RnfABCDGE type electron transport complex subunit D [Candidatus Marinimicrobia bacterium]|nr:RnfABCDGE type electron transport complex subunit D [Candidatus Neomarinimicrobiota bacterium]MCF7827341.1 RnfABCDGE type electron transport complex subunit D [Candidatus Neomarinimicrobiota bacterium]MCF7881426.1 RnfABCDGE type electron transport complex subunit D [Candidatus Neomarinimicrobiota bacterium]